MKKLIIILSILIIGFSSYAQDVIGGRIIAKNSLFVRDRWVDTITVDTSNFLNYNRSIPTAGAVYEFVNARMSGGGGGSGTVTSVGMTVPSFLSVSGSPITTSGTFAVTLSGTALPAINGGTGQVSYAVGDLLYASTTTALSKLAAGTATYVLTSNGAGVAPSWQVIPSDNLIVQRAGSGIQTWFTSGDTLYLEDIEGSTFIDVTKTADSTINIALSATGTPSSSTYLRGDNTWATIAGGGDVTKVGTPANNQLGVWTGDGTIEGTNDLTFDGTTLSVGGVVVPTISSTNTLTNKRWTARVGSTTSSGTPTINTDNVDIYKLTAQAEDITSFTTNLSGTPVDGDILEIQVTGTAARAITWGASFVASTVALPTTTVTTATLTTVFQYFTTSSYGNNKWVCVNSF